METKEIIQEAALDLFSQKGFDSSSVRDIAAKTGIKDSSLYFRSPPKMNYCRMHGKSERKTDRKKMVTDRNTERTPVNLPL